MKHSIKLSLIALILFSISCSNEPLTETINETSSSEKISSDKSTSDVYNPINDEVVGTSTLHRNEHGITVNFKTTDLMPGHAYTLWWIIWNNPEECKISGACNDPDFDNYEAVGVDALYAAGHVADDSGVGTFSARLNVGDTSGSIFTFLGLEKGKTFSAEVHLVLRSHGPAIPGMINEQISSYGGGCEVELGIFVAIPENEGECGDIEYAIHSPVEE